jgi:hypothetical protein
MRKCIFNTQEYKEHKVQRVGIAWAEDKGYIRHGVVGGILDHGPMYSKNVCHLVSRVSGRKIRVRYRPELHPLMCAHMGQRCMITGTRYYDITGKLDSMDAEAIDRNEMPYITKADHIISANS